MKYPLTRIALISLCLTASAIPCRAAAEGAKELIDSMGCRGCHVIEQRGGALGPSLDGVGKRLGRQELRRQLIEPRVQNPASAMPSYDHLSGDQLDLLIDFLRNLK